MTVDENGLIGNIVLKNRIVRSATNDYRGDEKCCVSKEQMLIYEKLAETPIGLIITGNFAVSDDGRIDSNQNCLKTEEQINSAKILCDICHKGDSKVVMQLSHSGMKSRMPQSMRERNYDVNTMSLREIKEVINQYACAAMEAMRAGFDGVEIHLSHGYLLSDFLNPLVNKRTDEYGLDKGNMRIISDLFDCVRFLVGEDYPILVKITSFIEGYASVNNELFLSNLLKTLEYNRAAAVELSGLNLADYKKEDRLYYLDVLADISEETSLPIILTGGIRDTCDVVKAFDAGADYIGFSRPFIRQPSFASLLLNGEGSKCISCNACYRLKEGTRRCAMEERI